MTNLLAQLAHRPVAHPSIFPESIVERLNNEKQEDLTHFKAK